MRIGIYDRESNDRLYDLFTQGLTCTAHPWLAGLRKQAFIDFTETGLPTVRHEDWKYTNVLPFFDENLALPQGASMETARGWIERERLEPSSAVITLVNGRYWPSLSGIPEDFGGVTAVNLDEALFQWPERVRAHLGTHDDHRKHPLSALNLAFARDGAFVHIEKDSRIQKPIYVFHLTLPGAEGRSFVNTRSLVIAEPNSEATIVEKWIDGDCGAAFSNSVTEISVGAGARVRHVKWREKAADAVHVHRIHTDVDRDGSFRSYSITEGERLDRTDIDVSLNGEGAETELLGLYVLTDKRHADHHTFVDHRVPNTRSDERYKGILDGASDGVFNGKVFVRPDARKTRAAQKNDNLLLSSDATVNTKPQLEILADDVRCGHGATVGRLQPDALFYLQSRGIGKEQAERMLVRAFAAEILEAVPAESVKSGMTRRLFGTDPGPSKERTS